MREHDSGQDCWCLPYLEHRTEGGREVWIHRAEDGELPPPWLVAEAILEASVP